MKSITESAAAALGTRGSGLGNFSAGAGIRVLGRSCNSRHLGPRSGCSDMDIDYAINTGSRLDSIQKISVKKKF